MSFRSPFVSFRLLTALATLLLLGAIAPSASARRFEVRRHPHLQAIAKHFQTRSHPRLRAIAHSFMQVALPDLGSVPEEEAELPTEGKQYELKLAHQGGEVIDVVYRIGDTYVPEALDKLSHFLRDSHNQEVSAYDPRTFDVLHTMLEKVGHSTGVINILSGYRTQETNDALRASGTTNAAEHSQHIEGKAIDIRVPGVSPVYLRDAALSLGAGGVGYYPKGGFVHVDTGPVRQWTYAPHSLRRAHRRRRA